MVDTALLEPRPRQAASTGSLACRDLVPGRVLLCSVEAAGPPWAPHESLLALRELDWPLSVFSPHALSLLPRVPSRPPVSCTLLFPQTGSRAASFLGTWTDQSGTWEPQVRPSKTELKAWPLDQGHVELCAKPGNQGSAWWQSWWWYRSVHPGGTQKSQLPPLSSPVQAAEAEAASSPSCPLTAQR